MPVGIVMGTTIGIGIAFLQGYVLKEKNWRFAFEIFRFFYVIASVLGLYNAVTWHGETTSSWHMQVQLVFFCVAFLIGWHRSWKIWRLT